MLSSIRRPLHILGQRACLIASLVTAAACTSVETAADPLATDDIVEVRVQPDSLNVTVGQNLNLSAAAMGPGNRMIVGERINWTSSDPTLASVDSLGAVRVHRAGTTEVRASARGKSGRARLVISPVPVATVRLSPASAALQVGQQLTVIAELRSSADSVLSGRRISWSSSNPAVAQVDTLGRVSARAVGSVLITATSETQPGVASITVTAAPPPPPATVINLAVVTIADTTATLQFSEVNDGLDAPASYQVRFASPTITWATATPVLRGTCAGTVTGSSIGATRSCTIRGLNAQTAYQFQVVAFRGVLGAGAVLGSVSNIVGGTTTERAVAAVHVTPLVDTLILGDTVRLNASVRDAAGAVLTGRPIVWSSQTPAVVSVSATGLVSAIALGTGTVRATSGTVSGNSTIVVVTAPPAPVANVQVSPSVDTVAIGQSVPLTVQLRDAGGNVLSGRTVSWSSVNIGVATVTSGGLVAGVAAGTTQIRATSEGVVGTASVHVPAPVPVPTAVVMQTQPGGAVLGATLSPQPVVRVVDAQSQTVNGAFVVTASIASGAGVLTGNTVVNATAGVATFTGLAIGGTAGAHTLRFTVTGLSAATSNTISILAPPPPGSIDFTSDWSTATGYSRNAVTDGGKWPAMQWWTGTGTPETNGRIVAASGLGFPSGLANVLRVSYHVNPGSSGNVLISPEDNRWPVPAVGQTLFHRFYFRNALRNTAVGGTSAGNHPVQGMGHDPISGTNCTMNWEYKWGSNSNGTFGWNVTMFQNNSRPGQGQWSLTGLQKFQTYLMEFAYTKVAANTYDIRVRIDGVDRTADFAGGSSNELRLGANARHTINDYCLRTLFVGNNDPGNTFSGSDPLQDFAYYGAFAVAVRADATAWIGPHTP